MRPDGEGVEEYVLNAEQEDRAVALAVARDLLLVKGGKFAERPLDPEHLITVATWILIGRSTREEATLYRDAVARAFCEPREGRRA